MDNIDDTKQGNRNQRFQNCKKYDNVTARRTRRLDKHSTVYVYSDESIVAVVRLGRQR